MGSKRSLYDCTKEADILASSHAKEYPPELVLFDEEVDLRINKCSTHKAADFSELEISDEEEELPNFYNRLGHINFGTFWQSCGTTPHEISFQFKRMVEAKRIEVWVSKVHEPSYCPETISLAVQRYFHSYMPYQTKTISDIEDVQVTPELELARYTFEFDEKDHYLTGFMFRILGNLEQGIESRVHCVRVLEPSRHKIGGIWCDNHR